MHRIKYMLPTIALLGVSAQGASADAKGPTAGTLDETTICIGGSIWRPTLEESRKIETVVVPETYRAQLESTTPCARWALDKASLIDWHMRFGSARSITAALAYLEQDFVRSIPAPARYAAELRRSFKSATPDLQDAAGFDRPTGLYSSLGRRPLADSESVRRLKVLVRAREDYIFLSEQFLRAAEEFDDPTLLDKAELYLRPAVDGADFLGPLERQRTVMGLLYFNLHNFRLDDLRARAALIRARITGRPDDVASARTLIQSQELPIYAHANKAAYGGGTKFCDISDGTSHKEEIEVACREDYDFDAQAFNFALNRAMLDMMADAEIDRPENADGRGVWRRSFELAVRLLAFEKLPDYSVRCCPRTGDEDMLKLLQARAYYGARRVQSENGVRGRPGLSQVWKDSLDSLQRAEKLAPPYEAPARFRRIATRWLDLWKAGIVLYADSDENPNPVNDPTLRRYEAYLKAALAGLDEGGAAPPTNTRR